ncbi:MAG: hypothetical protein H0T76_29215 [Nannocystis sp.]|nr:hypothetical protein [Nannocystis sp.]MBA3550575.1 hypothetical protein [Nannocystis sp.]
MKRHHSPVLSLSWSLLTTSACYSGGDAGSGLVDLETASSSPSSTSADPPTTSLPTTSTTSPTSPTSTSTTPGTTSIDSSTGTSTGDLDMSTGPGTASSGTTAELPSPSCGDAILDPGEECDFGAAQNNDQGACTLICKKSQCGDKLIWAGKETCDNGPDNNDNLYGGCTTQCQHGPRCDDGELQGPEECDLGLDNGTGEFPINGVPCGNGCRFQARLAFLSSVAYKAGDLGGVEGAHLKCQNLAKQVGLDSAANFKAWLSDAQHSPFADFNHAPETAGLAYVGLDGVRIADDWDDLILNGPGDGIIVTETGAKLLGTGVWTGTAPSGKVFDPNATCKSWSSSEAIDKSRRGLSGVDKLQGPIWKDWFMNKRWTSSTSINCNYTYRIYCFEQ